MLCKTSCMEYNVGIMIRKLANCLSVLLMLSATFASCSSKDSVSGGNGVFQASTKSTGSTNSNEKLNLSPYSMGVKVSQAKSSPDAEDELPESDSSKNADDEPPVYPVGEFLEAAKNLSSRSPAGPSVPSVPETLVPPSVEGSASEYLSAPPEMQEKREIPVAVVEEPKEPVREEPPVEEVPPAENEEHDRQGEYVRSIGSTSNITKEIFEEDKRNILNIIEKLSVVMSKKDYKTWLTFIDDASVKYWSNRTNLQKAQSRLPVKGLYLRTLEDYFKYVFIPSRAGRTVDEIRYENERQVKAVHVNGDNDTVYYNFKKSANGEWKLHLPPISD